MSLRKRETLHKRAVEWVTKKIGGVNNHYPDFGDRIKYHGMIPDVYVRQGQGRVIRIDEVEVHNLDLYKLSRYWDAKAKRVLWIVLTYGTSFAFDEIVLIEDDGKDGFKEIGKISIGGEK